MPEINADRLLGDLYALRKIGEYKTGVHRPSLSPEDIQSRHWLAGKLDRGRPDRRNRRRCQRVRP